MEIFIDLLAFREIERQRSMNLLQG